MLKRNIHKPSAGEMEILVILWKNEAATVRQIHDLLNARKPTAYTTTLKMLQIMAEKGMVKRDESNRAHIYRANLKREVTERTFAQELLNKVFSGSASQLILRVLESEPSSSEELAAIRQIIEEAERKVNEK